MNAEVLDLAAKGGTGSILFNIFTLQNLVPQLQLLSRALPAANTHVLHNKCLRETQGEAYYGLQARPLTTLADFNLLKHKWPPDLIIVML